MPFLFLDLRLMEIAFINCGNRNGELWLSQRAWGKKRQRGANLLCLSLFHPDLSSSPSFSLPFFFDLSFPSNHSEVASDPASPVPMARFAFLSLALFSVQALIGGTLAAVCRRCTV